MFERKRSCIFCLKPALGGDRVPVFGLCFQGHSCVTPGQSKVSRVLLCTSSRPALQESAQSSFRKLSGIRLWLQLNCNHVKYPNFVILLLERINVSSLRSHILINRERLCEQNQFFLSILGILKSINTHILSNLLTVSLDNQRVIRNGRLKPR